MFPTIKLASWRCPQVWEGSDACGAYRGVVCKLLRKGCENTLAQGRRNPRSVDPGSPSLRLISALTLCYQIISTLSPSYALNSQKNGQQMINETAEVYRKRLSSVSWFMKYLNEPIARAANKEDKCSGHFWDRFFAPVKPAYITSMWLRRVLNHMPC